MSGEGEHTQASETPGVERPAGMRDPASAEWLTGGGEMGRLIRSIDWSNTPLGPIDTWPQSLRTTISLCLASNFPIDIIWGPQRVQIYNDGYWPVCGEKHPRSMGQDFKECWLSAWPAIGEAFERASAGETSFIENRRIFIDRNGYLEETFFTFSLSPIRDETGGVGGVFHPVTELTQQTLAERRLQVLGDLANGTADVTTIDEACSLVAQTLAGHALDIPFALLYLIDADGQQARLAASTGLTPATPATPAQVDLAGGQELARPLADAVRSGQAVSIDGLEPLFGPLTCGPYPESPNTALVLPLVVPGLEHPLGVLVAGVSPRRSLDAAYRTFYDLLAGAVTNALINARSYEEERKRAEALAELDRAKTAFFSNVSHEFRTPLTLMLGPLEDALAEAEGPINRDRLELAHRSSLRLLKLVNTLLDFSRIEAGRVQAAYEPADLPALTADLASQFRAAIERAGLRLQVDCPTLPDGVTVYVDQEMWEKIVLNLLSNAFKFTLAGEIAVALQATGGGEFVRLTVRDTGTGIPAAELPRLFERFHRVQGARARTYEGTGIGLALVQELVKLHGGSIAVESELDRGTAFTVTLPTGRTHLPADRVGAAPTLASTGLGAAPFVEEALRWLPSEPGGQPTHPQTSALPAVLDPSELYETAAQRQTTAERILWADDNANMRAYVSHLLGRRYDVETAADGATALAAALARPPDLILTDIMMPGLDGFELLRALRAEPRTHEVPIILLSARAGEEAKVEGLEAGADDYLIKPFAARELLARVGAHLELARMRAEAGRHEQAARAVAEEAQARAELALRVHDEFLAAAAHDLRSPLTAIKGMAQTLRRRATAIGASGDTVFVEGLKSVDEAATMMGAQIDELLDLAHLRIGQPLELHEQPVDLSELVRQVATERQRGTDRHRIRVEGAEPPLSGIWDPVRLARVLNNLVDNAIKYSPSGGTITLALQRQDAADGNWAIVAVRDQGVGIPAADLPDIFERFQRAGNVGQIAGSGIGLASARQIVERHGGAITVESQEGAGSTFTVRLPCEPLASEPESSSRT